MSALKKFAAFFVAFACVAPMGSRADALSGTYTTTFNGDAGVWDISGTYNDSFQDMDLNLTINMEPSGKFTGQGSADVDVPGYGGNLHMDFNVTGAAKSSGSVVRVDMTMKMAGFGNIQGYDCTFNATVTENMEVDELSRQMTGSASGKVSVAVPAMKKKASASIPKTDISMPLPASADDAWDLTVNVNPAANKYSGTATAGTSTKNIPMVVSGSYNGKTGISKLTIKGTNDRALTLTATAVSVNGQIDFKALSGKVLGQTVRLMKK
jgi:hypothetical protein